MKKLITFCITLIITLSCFAQAPEKISYQAIVRDSNNNLIINETIGMQISILQGSLSGSPVYVETQTPSSNLNGLVSLEIGSGTLISGDFSNIDWSNGPFFIKTEIDPTGNTNYTITSSTQLLSVPYALHAKTANSAEVLLDNYISIWDDNSTVNLEPNKKYFINADNTTLVLPVNNMYFEKDYIEIYVMSHKDNPRSVTIDWTNSLFIGAMDSNNDFIGFGVNQPTTATGHFQPGYNKIINIGDYWMCGGFTPN